jgi:SWI/SNF-related matrix-associated actin-dependent regulator of chromatin subfamily A member 5
MDELQKWCPTFKVVRLHSTDENERQRLRKEVVMNVGSYDVAVTTYEMACNPTFNLTLSQKVYWRTMILDEGHKVKNEDTAAHAVLSRVHRQHTVLLTGTPVQNNMHELYAILAFLHPDVFTSARSFDDAFDLSAKEHRVDSKTLDHAHYLMKPFVLRRVKGEVEVSLPEKTETKIMCPLSPAQTFWYRRLLQRESSALTAVESAELKKHSGGGGGGDEKNASEQSASQNAGDARKLQSLLMQLA